MKKLKFIFLLFVAPVLLLGYTHSYFSDTVEVTGNTMTAGTWDTDPQPALLGAGDPSGDPSATDSASPSASGSAEFETPTPTPIPTPTLTPTPEPTDNFQPPADENPIKFI